MMLTGTRRRRRSIGQVYSDLAAKGIIIEPQHSGELEYRCSSCQKIWKDRDRAEHHPCNARQNNQTANPALSVGQVYPGNDHWQPMAEPEDGEMCGHHGQVCSSALATL